MNPHKWVWVKDLKPLATNKDGRVLLDAGWLCKRCGWKSWNSSGRQPPALPVDDLVYPDCDSALIEKVMES